MPPPTRESSKRANGDTQLARILSSLTDDKAEDIVQIDLRGKSAIGDYMVICSGRSTRQVAAIAEKLSHIASTHHNTLNLVTVSTYVSTLLYIVDILYAR